MQYFFSRDSMNQMSLFLIKMVFFHVGDFVQTLCSLLRNLLEIATEIRDIFFQVSTTSKRNHLREKNTILIKKRDIQFIESLEKNIASHLFLENFLQHYRPTASHSEPCSLSLIHSNLLKIKVDKCSTIFLFLPT